MFNLSTQEVVLSIENTPLVNLDGIIYQEYNNFFGKDMLEELLDINFANKNLVKLEKHENFPRLMLEYQDITMKKLKVFFMDEKIKSALERKFDTTLKFDSVDFWIDDKGYSLKPHTDDDRIKLAIQIYLGNDNIGTSLFGLENTSIKTFEYKENSGYALFNNSVSRHGTQGRSEKGNRKSVYVRYG